MKKVKIQYNELYCEQRPTTQEDNFGQIVDKWDLYKNDYDGIVIGNMVRYVNQTYAIFISGLRFDLPAKDVEIVDKMFLIRHRIAKNANK